MKGLFSLHGNSSRDAIRNNFRHDVPQGKCDRIKKEQESVFLTRKHHATLRADDENFFAGFVGERV